MRGSDDDTTARIRTFNLIFMKLPHESSQGHSRTLRLDFGGCNVFAASRIIRRRLDEYASPSKQGACFSPLRENAKGYLRVSLLHFYSWRWLEYFFATRCASRRATAHAAAVSRFGEARPCTSEAFEPAALDRASPAGGLLLSATKEMQKGHPRVAFFTFLFLERGSLIIVCNPHRRLLL